MVNVRRLRLTLTLTDFTFRWRLWLHLERLMPVIDNVSFGIASMQHAISSTYTSHTSVGG